jgi:hypothetical protein
LQQQQVKMSLQVNEHCHRLFQLTTSHGVLKIYIPEPLQWTNEISQYYLVTEALLPIRLDDEEEARLYLETKMNEFVELISKRDLPPPRFVLTNIFSLANQTAQPTIAPLQELTPDHLSPLQQQPPAQPQPQQEPQREPESRRIHLSKRDELMRAMGITEEMECQLS